MARPEADGPVLARLPWARRDPAAIRRTLAVARPMLRRYFRAEVRGMERVPAGPHLFVSNHNIGAPWEVFALLEAWEKQFPGRPICGLAHDLAFRVPLMRSWLPRLGAVRATHENGDAVLAAGGSLIIFPGGNWEAGRPFWQRHRCDLGGYRGWARIALRAGVPVVPIGISGSHAVNPVFWRSKVLAWLSLARPIFRVRWMPLTLAQILVVVLALGVGLPLLPWWGAALIAWLVAFSPLTVFFPLLPSRIVAQVGEPVDLQVATANLPVGEARVDAAYELIHSRIQDAMNAARRVRHVPAATQARAALPPE